MAVRQIERRVAALEEKLDQLQRELKIAKPDNKPWWESIVGTFADDPDYLEAMRLGREYRESLRPKPRAKPAKRAKRPATKKR